MPAIDFETALDRIRKNGGYRAPERTTEAVQAPPRYALIDDKTSAEGKLNAMAKARSAETGENFTKAFNNILDTAEGRQLYAEDAAERDTDEFAERVAKNAEIEAALARPAQSLTASEQRLDDLAKARAKKYGTPFAKAYNDVLATPEGRDLYAAVDEERSPPDPVEKASDMSEADQMAYAEREIKKIRARSHRPGFDNAGFMIGGARRS